MSRTLKYGLTLVGAIYSITFGLNLIDFIVIRVYRLSLTAQLLIFAAGSAAAALAVSMLVVVSAPVIKDYLATLRRLWRLENLSHPLLLKLSYEAPSTYFHSIVVANLAHRGAKAIGADPILARLGGYYHDIGKLAQPDIYIENSPDGNELAKLDPRRAAKLIVSHVKDGLKLARSYDLPPEITAFITQHHGTSFVSFFYEQAKANQANVSKQDFRYPGPKPLSKEAAVLMLADGIEAKTRSLPEYTEAAVAQAVDEIIEDKLSDGQLDLSGLSSRQLRKVRGAFIEAIKTMYHRRIKYPR